MSKPDLSLVGSLDDSPGLKRLLSESLDMACESADILLPRLVETARLHLGMEVGFISRFEDELRYFRFTQGPRESELFAIDTCDEREESYCQRVADGRLPRVIHDAQRHPGTLDMKITREYGIGAFVSAPIVLKDGTLYGSLCCFNFEANQALQDRDGAFISVLADLAAEVIDREVEAGREHKEKAHRIKRAMASGAMSMAWQPIVNISDGKLIGAEALARFDTEPWQPPNTWFADAADVGLTSELEKRALMMALALLEELPGDIYVACNLSAAALLDPEVRAVLEEVELSRVVLELTEHDIVADYESLIDIIAGLKPRGLRIAVDDFGAGYACFRHILFLKPDLIKLDISLVQNVDTQEAKRSLLEAMIGFAKASHQVLIAEGVESSSELQTLSALGVDLAQGYLLHKPMPGGAMLNLCARQA